MTESNKGVEEAPDKTEQSIAGHDHVNDGTGGSSSLAAPQGACKSQLPEMERLVEDGDIEDRDAYWLEHIYQGHNTPQLTWRAVLMGGVLGSLMSIANLYTSIKVGWAFGVAITSCVLSYAIWNTVRFVFPKVSPMTILENNCMQSTASAAGYSTGATVGTAFGALLLITGKHVAWPLLLAWTLVTAALGVLLAVPMKRQMINQENLPFPSGIAAAETLRSLYGRCGDAAAQAKALVASLFAGLLVGFLGNGKFGWQTRLSLKLPELVPFNFVMNGTDFSKMQAFGFTPSVLLTGAGMIVGMRVSASMLLGSCILYFIVGPFVIGIHEASPEKLTKWALWTGTGLMVSSGLTAFALQWKTISRAFQGWNPWELSKAKSSRQELDEIEVPARWLIIGLVPLTLAMIVLQACTFHIPPLLGLLSVVMSFFLALVACRATGETDITPIGAMGKLTQLAYALVLRTNMTANLMAGSVTANIASSSADLLTDLKSGYLLGANARRQFIAQFIGLFFGAAAIVPAWYLMIPNQEMLDSYNPPSVYMWKAVAEALSHGIGSVPYHARIGLLIGGLLGIALALVDACVPKRIKPFLPSAMGLGLSWVVPFTNSLSFFVGALIALLWKVGNRRSAALFVIPVASGAVAGESLMCALLKMSEAAAALYK